MSTLNWPFPFFTVSLKVSGNSVSYDLRFEESYGWFFTALTGRHGPGLTLSHFYLIDGSSCQSFLYGNVLQMLCHPSKWSISIAFMGFPWYPLVPTSIQTPSRHLVQTWPISMITTAMRKLPPGKISMSMKRSTILLIVTLRRSSLCAYGIPSLDAYVLCFHWE